jgi:hypothetical protein
MTSGGSVPPAVSTPTSAAAEASTAENIGDDVKYRYDNLQRRERLVWRWIGKNNGTNSGYSANDGHYDMGDCGDDGVYSTTDS